MRTHLLVALIALAAPMLARADLTLRLTRFDGLDGSAVHVHLDVPRLQVGLVDLGTDGSGAGENATNPTLALVLGIFPGFGLGHYIAGSPQWTTWTLIDVIVLAAAIAVTAADVSVLTALAWIAFVGEHVIEGIDAYKKAGGRFSSLAATPETLAFVGEARWLSVPAARAPGVQLARF